MSKNPYASPAHVPAVEAELADPRARARPLRAFGRWTLVCSLSAAPSFFWGCALHRGPQNISGMLVGILTFILGYTLIECTRYYHQIITLPHVHRTVLIGYATRILISVIFPLGLTLDMFTGAISISLSESLLATGYGGRDSSFLDVLLTTVIQGLLLNVILFAYMACVYGVLRLFAVVRSRTRPGDEATAKATSDAG